MSEPSTSDHKPGPPHDRERAEGKVDSKPEPPLPKPTRLDPTRYGDWEKNGRCIDF